MVWTAPSIELHSLQSKGPGGGPGDVHEFVATGSGFVMGTSQLVFVRANIESSSGLKPYQVVPCHELNVKEVEDGQELGFKATFGEREGGTYHLIGWNPPLQGGNQVCVLEWVMGIGSVPGKPVEVVVK
ncbi:MAG: hypothetical protein HOW73_49280 [Polyangiaceae bacterium]|nr:hypothetical protein [Polyangiaceae bacterium]